MSSGSTPATPQHLTLQEFSAISRLSPSTIHRLIKAGKIPFVQPAGKGGKLLFPLNAIELMATRTLDRPSAPAVASGDDCVRLSGPRPKWTQAPKRG
ncbi:Helix-turn-helix domain protein [Anatilimnocola aggregata]|uniref:Helix-turn-helix domain protein n=1 Tax=Anatilimnocola aggregata TaxID=2528021 RepID=A0A517Y8V4_9BACT|nr:helix-turn-helix domain-containing protein [Anatilimnocola aggregata]QDU26645.1 Helix-turn-helix domain protein [Anatilimnocola aggregata]